MIQDWKPLDRFISIYEDAQMFDTFVLLPSVSSFLLHPHNAATTARL